MPTLQTQDNQDDQGYSEIERPIGEHKESFVCPDSSFTVSHKNGSVTCLVCKHCAEGFGLFPDCGSKIREETLVGCQPCPNGTYSVVGICVPCSVCGPYRDVDSACTVTEDTRCSNTCHRGYYLDIIADECAPCSICCSNNGIHPKCVSDGTGLHCKQTYVTEMCRRKYLQRMGLFNSKSLLNNLFTSKQGSPSKAIRKRVKHTVGIKRQAKDDSGIETGASSDSLPSNEINGSMANVEQSVAVNVARTERDIAEQSQSTTSTFDTLTTRLSRLGLSNAKTKELIDKTVIKPDHDQGKDKGENNEPTLSTEEQEKKGRQKEQYSKDADYKAKNDKEQEQNGANEWTVPNIVETSLIGVMIVAFIIFGVCNCYLQKSKTQSSYTTQPRNGLIYPASASFMRAGGHFFEEGQPLLHQSAGVLTLWVVMEVGDGGSGGGSGGSGGGVGECHFN